MLVKDWITLLEKIPPQTEIKISVDISTDEDNFDLRVFATELLGYQEPDTILLSGVTNHPVNC